VIVPGDANPLLMGGADGYQISRSVRLRQSASAYFNRTPSSNGSRQIMTFSFWMKRGLLTYASSYLTLFSAYPVSSSVDIIAFSPSSDSLRIFLNGSVSADLITTQVFRDPSAWYHVVVAIDTTQATASNRIKMYVNGSQITSFSTATYPTQNYNTYWNSTSYAASIGANLNGPQSYFDGYLTEINFIDGQALTPSSFGATSTTTGVWGPAKYTGTYGTNGFYLNFSDNSSNTATTIGKDSSGNGNNWTPNNISVTAGVTYDSMVDTPTPYGSDSGVGGEVRGNYAVLNPLGLPPSGYSAGTFAAGNLNFTTGGVKMAKSTMALPLSGKWYIECSSSGTSAAIDWVFGLTGMSAATPTNHSNPGVNLYISDTAYWLINAASQFTQAGAISSSDIFQIAYDASTGKVWLGKNNTYYTSAGSGTGNPSSGTNQFATLSTTTEWCAYTGGNTGTVTSSINFGQRAFAYTAPTGFKALCTQNLPTPTISNGANYMASTLYTGNGATGQSVVNTSNGVSFAPDFAWVKVRSSAGTDHYLADTVRGATKYLQSNTTAAEGTNNGITAFNSNGFSVGAVGDTNTNAATIVGWQWKANGAAVTNTAGSITSTVSANTTAGFSVVTYTGTGANATIGHGIGVAPSMVIIFERSPGGDDHIVYHSSLTSNQYAIRLNTTAAQTGAFGTYWNSTSPTSSVFSVGTSGENNQNTATYVAYCFAPIAGYSAFGSYTGNGSTDGPFVYTGFRPRYILIKKTSAAQDWFVYDTARDTYNEAPKTLFPNGSYAEESTRPMDILSNGFKLRISSATNDSGATYIYAAFAENPFKYALAR